MNTVIITYCDSWSLFFILREDKDITYLLLIKGNQLNGPNPSISLGDYQLKEEYPEKVFLTNEVFNI